MQMKRVGPHVSISGGVQNAPLNAQALGAKAFGMFTKNQRQWQAKPLGSAEIDAFTENMTACGFTAEQVLPHDGYLINMGNPDRLKREQSCKAFLDEMQRCELLGLKYLNMHPGSHLQEIGIDECIGLIAAGINHALDKTRGVTVVIENTAGQGSNVGHRFEHLAAIIDKVEDKQRVGVCLDTCHLFAAGYDLRTPAAYTATFREFDAVVGQKYLRGMHLNDAKAEFGSKKDRHHSIGLGTLGLEPFRLIMNDKRFEEIPLILETIDEERWAGEIRQLYSFVKKK
jgi:deoxyribonuclease-4